MRFLFIFFLFAGCTDAGPQMKVIASESRLSAEPTPIRINPKTFEPGSWQHFLQNLKVIDTPVVDYHGKKIRQQFKSAGVIPYDVGTRDLQQCADALMRLRAEYLFSRNRQNEIGFHFVSGDYYSFNDYCSGKKPVPQGNGIRFITGDPSSKTHASLRKYLDIVYTYASTISLARELKSATSFEAGTIVVTPGSPGHCFIIIDEGVDESGEKVFRLAEGYTPAQSIYVLRNPEKEGKDPWQSLKKGTISTASYTFEQYRMVRFE